MRFLSHVVWSEGMHLTPQHFSRQSRYFEDLLWFLQSSLTPFPWGLLSLTLNEDAIRNGLAGIRAAAGIFPDGLAFEIPDSDPLPEPLRLRELFGPLDNSVLLQLSVALREEQSSLSAGPAHRRYLPVERSLRDETISEDEYPVTLGQKNLRLVGGTATTAQELALPLARIVRDGEGGFAVDPAFLPPLLRVHAAPDLLRRLRALTQAVGDKIDTTRRGGRHGRFEAGTSALDVASHWFLHTLCTALPALEDHLRNRRVHPETLYTTLVELAGALCTFAPDSDPAALPAYDHLQPFAVFRSLEDHIYRHLEYVVPSNTFPLQFQKTAETIYVAPVPDERFLRRARWIFGIRSNVPELTLMRGVPTLAKVCSGEGVVKLVQLALQGLTLTHLPSPPSAIAAQADMQYFSVERSGPCWEHILATRQVGVYLPGELGHPVFEMTVVLETES